MGRYSTLTNQPIDVHVENDYFDQGWSVVGGRAVHESCNSGTITNRELETVPGITYKVTYTVSGYSSGDVYAIVGGVQGLTRTADGTYVEEFTAVDDSGLKFWSDGDLAVSLIQVSDGEVDGVTLAFNEKYDKWVGNRSYLPTYAAKFLDDVFVFRNGTMWKQGANDTRNNFFGQQYPSIITFYMNVNPHQVKTLFSMRQNGNKPWSVTEIEIPPRMGKSQGQLSRLLSGNFKNLQGQFFGDFMRDMLDPRFVTPEQALFKGAVLQGETAKITMEIQDTGEVRLVSVDILGSTQNYTY